jgi:hypothetical protein
MGAIARPKLLKSKSAAEMLRALATIAKPRAELIVGAFASLAVSFAALVTSYDGFAREALSAPAAWVLFAVNAVFTVILILLLTAWIKPTRKVTYAVLVAFGFQALIATDLQVQPLAGTEEVGALSSVRLGAIYNPVEKALSSGIEDPIEEAKRAEITALRARYATEPSLPTMRASLEDTLATEGSVADVERTDIMKRVDAALAARARAVRDRVRDVALILYASAGRDVVRDLIGKDG